jgi:hypothetical protein
MRKHAVAEIHRSLSVGLSKFEEACMHRLFCDFPVSRGHHSPLTPELSGSINRETINLSAWVIG